MRGIYLVGGYPDRESYKEYYNAVVEAGFEFIEVGIPFNDPTADGPVIAKTAIEAIGNGVKTSDIIDDLKAFDDNAINKYVMTYSNVVYSYGIKKFSDSLKGHLKGIIVADLPGRLAHMFYDEGFEIPIVPFATLETREDDIELIKKSQSEFIYFVGVRGITGARADYSSSELLDKLAMLKEKTDKKIIIGFGIKTKEDADRALEIADGYVIGTEAVKRQGDLQAFKEYLQSVI